MIIFKTITRTALATALLGTASASALLAAEVQLDSEIERVKLYRDHGAVVHRSGTFSLPEGVHTVVIQGLPADLDLSYGVRAAIPTEEGTIIGVTLEKVFNASTTSAEQKIIEDQIADLMNRMESDRATLEAIDIELSFLGKLTSSDASSSADTLNLIRENARRLTNEKLSLNQSLSDNSRKILALEQQLKQTGTLRKATTTATLTLVKSSDGPAQLDISYLSRAASWSVSAKADVDTNAGTLDLKLTAQIRQQTGENWNNIPVTLSTSRLNYSLGADLPRPIYNNISDKPRPRLAEERLERPSAPMVLADMAGKADNADVSIGNFEAEFSPSQPLSLASNGAPRDILVLSESVPIGLKVRISPNFASGAYLYGTATFTNVPSLSSPQVTITRDGQYLGQGRWPDLTAGKPIELPLGYIEQIKTEVTKLPSEDGETGIFGRSIIDETKNRFTVTNNLSSGYVVEVYDVLPQSMNEDLEINPLRGSTNYSETDVDGQPGVVMWRKTMTPSETWSINHWYRTRYPQGQVLTREWR